jgi:hypothetical protein
MSESLIEFNTKTKTFGPVYDVNNHLATMIREINSTLLSVEPGNKIHSLLITNLKDVLLKNCELCDYYTKKDIKSFLDYYDRLCEDYRKRNIFWSGFFNISKIEKHLKEIRDNLIVLDDFYMESYY